jgi:NitT/TauT family transport system substrate-binding protein
VKRSTFVMSMTTAAASGLAPRLARTQGLTRIRIAGSPDQDIIGALWGQQSGIFRKYGLDVETARMNSGAVVAAALLGGSLEIGKSSMFGLITGHVKGVPFLIEAPAALYRSAAPDTALVVAKDSPIKTGRDLDGKTLSVPALGDFFTIANSAWIDQNGGDSRTVKFIELPHRAAAEAIAAGRIAAASLAEPILDDALASGKCRILGRSLDAIGKRFIVTCYFCASDYATKNADVLARFRKAIFEANAYANAHQREMMPIIAAYSGVDEKVIASMPQTVVGSLADLRDPGMIQPLIDAAVKYRAIPARFPAKELIDPAAL